MSTTEAPPLPAPPPIGGPRYSVVPAARAGPEHYDPVLFHVTADTGGTPLGQIANSKDHCLVIERQSPAWIDFRWPEVVPQRLAAEIRAAREREAGYHARRQRELGPTLSRALEAAQVARERAASQAIHGQPVDATPISAEDIKAKWLAYDNAVFQNCSITRNLLEAGTGDILAELETRASSLDRALHEAAVAAGLSKDSASLTSDAAYRLRHAGGLIRQRAKELEARRSQSGDFDLGSSVDQIISALGLSGFFPP